MENVEILCVVLVSILISAFLIFDFLHKKKLYESGSYYKITKTPFISIGRDIGSYGEYLIYGILKYLELEKAKFLFNLYIPTYNGKTTEIDIVMISQCGILCLKARTTVVGYLEMKFRKNGRNPYTLDMAKPKKSTSLTP